MISISLKHIVIEGTCFFDVTNSANKPACCKSGPGNIGVHCLSFDEKERKLCPYFAFGTARSSIVLTDQKGDSVGFNGFWSDEDLSDEEWLKQEEEWIIKWKKKLSD